MDKRFERILKQNYRDPYYYYDVFKKCREFTRLTGNEYIIANTLAELGLMQVLRTPIFHDDTFYDLEVKFKSIY